MRSKALPIGLFLGLAVIPLLAGLFLALLLSLGAVGVLSEGWTLEHWEGLLSDPALGYAALFSIYVATSGTFIALGLSLLITISGRQLRHKSSYQGLLYAPLALPALVMAFYTFHLLGQAGLLSRLAYGWGWIDAPSAFPLLVGDKAGLGIIFAHTMMSTFFFSVYFAQLWPKEQMDDLLEVARNLGSSYGQSLRRVAIPALLLRSRSMIGLYFVFALGSYEIPLLLGRSYPQMLSVFAVGKLQRFNLGDVPQAYALALLYALVMAAVLFTLGMRKSRAS